MTSNSTQLTAASQVIGDNVCKFCGSEEALIHDPDHKNRCTEYLRMMKVALEEEAALQKEAVAACHQLEECQVCPG